MLAIPPRVVMLNRHRCKPEFICLFSAREMKSWQKLGACSIFALILSNCAPPLYPPLTRIEPGLPIPFHPLPKFAGQFALTPDTIVKWVPRYIPSGFATGIMIEFKGVKEGKTLNAQFSILQCARLDLDTTFQRLYSKINDLRQAFFSLPAGTYMIRHSTPWADQSIICDVTVLNGKYSVIELSVARPLRGGF